jgi:hypothetical protein
MNRAAWNYRLAIGALLSLSIATTASAQTSTASLSGVVRDQSSAVMVGVSLTLNKTDTNQNFKTVTNGEGFYLFPGLVPGSYRLTAEAPGMEKFEGALVVRVEQSAVVDVTMKVGQPTAQVAVQDVTPTVSTDNGTINYTLERDRIEQLPINGRQVSTLLVTIPGMEGFRSFGIEDHAYDFVVDGATIADRYGWNSIPQRQPGLDSVQEFAVLENAQSAKYARPITIVLSTKSGNNQLHGSIFETNRNNAYGLARARTDYYTKPPFLNRNEFGVSGGGPVYLPKLYNGKNKTFWFFSYEALRQVQNTTSGFPVPTPAWRSGDMSNDIDSQGIPYIIYNPYSTDASTWTRQPFPNNQIPSSMQSPLAKYLLDVTPLPTLPNVNPNIAPNWYGAVPSTQRNWTVTSRVDQRISDKDTFYGRYTQGGYKTLSQFYSQPSLDWKKVPAGTQGYDSPNRSVALSWLHTFSPTLFNEIVASGSWAPFFVGTGDLSTDYDAQMGLPNPFGVGGWPGLYQAGFPNVGSNLEWETQNTNAARQFYGVFDDNATKVWGKHELQFGFHYRYDQMDMLPAQQQVAGNNNFATLATSLYDPASSRTNPLALPYTGDTYANFYLGVANYSNQYVRGMFYGRAKEYAAYLQDNWKVTPRLTINLGVRYEYWPPFTEKHNVVVSFDPANQAIVLGNDPSSLARLGFTTPSILAREQQLGVKFETAQQAGMPGSLFSSNKLDFAPRLGFAYRLGGGSRPFVLRGGYALSYFHLNLNMWSQRMRMNAPMNVRFYNSLTQAAYSPDGIGNFGLRSVPTIIAGKNSNSDIISTTNANSIQPGSPTVDYFALNQPDPRVHNWNITLEKELPWEIVVNASYIGNHSYGNEQLYNFNATTPAYIWYTTTGQPLPTGTYASTGTNYFNQTAYGTLEEWINTGWGNSNGLQLQAQRRFKNGSAFQFFYVLDNNFGAGGQGYSGTSQIPTPNQFMPGAIPVLSGIPTGFSGNLPALDRLINYQRDTTIPQQRYRWNWVQDIPIGRGKPILRNAGGVLEKLIGGWQVAGIGTAASTYFTLPATYFPTGEPLEVYGYKYPIQNCTSGTCYPGYLYWNGYIPSNLINSHDASGAPNGYEGIPANYKPAAAPLIPYGATSAPNMPAGTNLATYYNTNTVWVPLNNGTVQRTTWSGLAPLRQQYISGIRQWGLDASLVKNVSIKERARLRLQCDFFNVLNHPGNPNSIGTTGILSVQSSGNSPRTLQLSGRLSW